MLSSESGGKKSSAFSHLPSFGTGLKIFEFSLSGCSLSHLDRAHEDDADKEEEEEEDTTNTKTYRAGVDQPSQLHVLRVCTFCTAVVQTGHAVPQLLLQMVLLSRDLQRRDGSGARAEDTGLILAFASSGFAVRVRPFVVFLVIHLYIYNALLLSVSRSFLTRSRKERKRKSRVEHRVDVRANSVAFFEFFLQKTHSRFSGTQMRKRTTLTVLLGGTRGFASSARASLFSVGGALLSSRMHGSVIIERRLRRRSGRSSRASGDDVLPPKSSSLHESLGNEGPGEKRWSVKELVERSSGNRSSNNSSGCVISAEEFRKTAESVKLSFDDQEEEQLARREVEEIVRFSQMVLSSSSSSSDAGGGGGGENNSADDGVEERAAERNGPTPRRRADE